MIAAVRRAAEAAGHTLLLVRTINAVTMVLPWPYRHIQVILKQYGCGGCAIPPHTLASQRSAWAVTGSTALVQLHKQRSSAVACKPVCTSNVCRIGHASSAGWFSCKGISLVVCWMSLMQGSINRPGHLLDDSHAKVCQLAPYQLRCLSSAHMLLSQPNESGKPLRLLRRLLCLTAFASHCAAAWSSCQRSVQACALGSTVTGLNALRRSLAEVVSSFDVDACCVLWDGTKVQRGTLAS